MRTWNTPNLVELNTKLTANGSDGKGQDEVTRTFENNLGQTVIEHTFTSVDDIS